MDAEQYKVLLEKELKNGCTLILGPEFCRLNEAETLKESLRDFMARHLSASTYINEDGFFYSDEITSKNTIVNGISDFYRDLGSQEIPFYYHLIAQMPFNFIISLSPDDLMQQALVDQQKEHSFVYFKRGSELNELSRKPLPKAELYEEKQIFTRQKINDIGFTPSKKKALLFNFLGIHDDTESLVFTYDSLFQFLYAIFPESKLPEQLRLAITSSSSFLLLGFRYDKWYLKIIFFLLEKIFESAQMELKKRAIFNFSPDQKKTVDFYKNEFEFKFSQETTQQFIYQLYNDCAATGQLYTPPKETAPDLPCRIVHISSNPDGVNYLDFEREFNRINGEWLKSRFRNRFAEPKRLGAATQKDLLNVLRDEDPEILVVSVHGKEDLTLSFSDDKKQVVSFSVENFKKDLASQYNHGKCKSLKGIIFHCCNSSEYASELVNAGLVENAIGMEGKIKDVVIPEFTEGFFGAYFTAKNFAYAYESGIRYLEKKGEEKNVYKEAAGQPKLFTKSKS